MHAYLINTAGEMEQVDVLPAQYRKLLKQGYRKPTPQERIAFVQQQKKEKTKGTPPDMLDVFFFDRKKQ